MRLWRNRHPRRAYWEKSEKINPGFYYFKQLTYKPIELSKPDLGLALAGADIDMGPLIDMMFTEYAQSFICWIVHLVHYEPINPIDQIHKGFDAYLSATPTRILKRFGIINWLENP